MSEPEGRGAAWSEERGARNERGATREGGAFRRPGGERETLSPAGLEPSGSNEVAGRIIALLTAREQTVAVAESLTGGLLAAALTGIPGASAAFRGAVVAYATSLKATLLDVPRPMLDARGAVSPEVAAAMAEGVRGRLDATFGAATTGVAGPDPAEGKPVGTVHVAVSAAGGTTVRTLALAGGRDEVRQRTVEAVLSLLLRRVREECS